MTRCKMCMKEIRHNGRFWEHIGGYKPRHPAMPEYNVANQKTKTEAQPIIQAQQIIRLLQTPEKANELINELDSMAAGINNYEYGLPTYDDSHMARMREIIYNWIARVYNACLY